MLPCGILRKWGHGFLYGCRLLKEVNLSPLFNVQVVGQERRRERERERDREKNEYEMLVGLKS